MYTELFLHYLPSFAPKENRLDLNWFRIREIFLHLSPDELIGPDAQYKLAPKGRAKPDINLKLKQSSKEASVLALITKGERNQAQIILTKRQSYPGVHSGQISFPGGKKEKSDADHKDTALRETFEEIGIQASKLEVLSPLSPLYIPPSNFLVHPFLAVNKENLEYRLQPSEVKRLIITDLSNFLDSNNQVFREISIGDFTIKTPAYDIEDEIVWGATAMMISEIVETIKTKY